MRNFLNFIQRLRHRLFHTKVRWSSANKYTCLECFGRQYEAGWMKRRYNVVEFPKPAILPRDEEGDIVPYGIWSRDIDNTFGR
jgi:hypothetical protein